ncbi:X antigen family member 2 [Physeter macrocephalus]|uniref:X antigen family member 2 n=1 Tax=Physeter macrocephalus TaxID=9755 RepID=A0A9W2WE81_PHYMC|nr:X antigen family member 2 [Physeter catodon]
MSRRIKSTYRPKERVYDQGYPRALGPVVFQQPADKQPEQEEPVTESQDITPDQEIQDEGASSVQVQGSALEANQQELAQPKTGCGCGDGSDVKGKRLPNPEPIKEPEAGMLSITHANYRVSVFHNIIFLII